MSYTDEATHQRKRRMRAHWAEIGALHFFLGALLGMLMQVL